jgi:protein-S-isoprenylcysteine O-methyltransferase Ste14
MQQVLETIGWLACIVYSSIPLFWFLIHSRTNFWRSRRRSPYLVLLPAWVLMWMALAALTAPWRHAALYRTPLAWLPAIALFALGLFLYSQGGQGFTSAQLSGRHELEPQRHEQRLVTAGIRQRIRHPVYVAHFCEMLAWSVGTGLAALYGLTAFALITGAVMIRMEERELEQRFGEEYRQYKRRVPAVVPKLHG